MSEAGTRARSYAENFQLPGIFTHGDKHNAKQKAN